MIRLRQIKIKIENDNLNELKKQISIKLKVDAFMIKELQIQKKSIDARHKENIYFVYEVDVKVENEKSIISRVGSSDIFIAPREIYKFEITGNLPKNPPIVVGSGPAGLFSAYLLAEARYHPIIIERGEKIEERIISVDKFWCDGILNPDSNVQFGEGGAGTFSDGKLNTLVKDKAFRMKKVFEIFVENGAPKEIMYENKPHIGTDILRTVVRNIRNKIISMGGTFYYNTCLTDIVVQDNHITEIEVNHNKKIPCDILVLAIGHSARDTFKMLYSHNIVMSPKPFAVGVRIQHLQRMINKSQHGKEENSYLGNASYKLTYTTSSGRGVYTFCMCPGGYVVNASSEKERLAINGMSNYARDTENANSAIVVTVTPRDFGDSPLDGIEYQRKLEEAAYKYGHGNIPVQLLGDFVQNSWSTGFKKVSPVCKGRYTFANLNDILPKYISDSLKEAFPYFDKKIKGFASEDAILSGIESRTSSPVRINRDEFYMSNVKGIYPCGEGSGYAGGITTSAMDGIKVAEAILNYIDT